MKEEKTELSKLAETMALYNTVLTSSITRLELIFDELRVNTNTHIASHAKRLDALEHPK